MSDPDSELEEDEEEILVYVEFDNFATNDVFSKENLKLDMLGLDSDHPIMQINGKFFEGTYEDAPGTYMFFEKDNNPEIDDPVFDKIPTLKYFNKTRKLLKMQRAFLVPRYEVVGDSNHSKCIPNKETLKEAGVPPKYQDQALAFWNDSRSNRLEALHKYLKKQEFRKELRLRGFEPESESDEDNPFAMYKYADNELNASKYATSDQDNTNQELEEKLKDTLESYESVDKKEEVTKKLTVIDPGPSTSKSSTPWFDDLNEDPSFSGKVKSVGRGQSKNAKGKTDKRELQKTRASVSETTENPVNRPLEVSNGNNTHEKTVTSLVNKNAKAGKNKTPLINGKQKARKKGAKNIVPRDMEIDETAIEESERLLVKELNLSNTIISDKQKQKQEKREAKMKEISERLKAMRQKCSQSKS